MNLNLKLTCPHCGKESHMAAFGNTEYSELARLAAKFGRAWPWVWEYCQSFQSAPDKPLKPARVKLLLEEIAVMIDPSTGSGCGFRYDGQFHGVRSEAIYAACREVALANKTGFKNHNYLKKVAIGKNLQLIQKEEKEQTIKAVEARRRDPDAPAKIRELIGSIGG